LPIAESLAHGKFCVASNRTSIPEVGGDLIDYFDPSDDDDALAKIERLLFEPGYLAAREARLLAEYRRHTWADCARSLVRGLNPQGPQAIVSPARDPHERLTSASSKPMTFPTKPAIRGCEPVLKPRPFRRSTQGS
jgi:hypothetical protein